MACRNVDPHHSADPAGNPAKITSGSTDTGSAPDNIMTQDLLTESPPALPLSICSAAGYDTSRAAFLFVSSGIRTTSQRYRSRACVVHLGSFVFEGHYQVILASPGGEWHIKDDHALAGSCYVEAHGLVTAHAL